MTPRSPLRSPAVVSAQVAVRHAENALRAAETAYYEALLRAAGGRDAAARALGTSPRSLSRALAGLGLTAREVTKSVT